MSYAVRACGGETDSAIPTDAAEGPAPLKETLRISRRKTQTPAGTGVSILVLQGDLSLESKDSLDLAYSGLVSPDHRLLLDFSSVTYMNSSGIAVIIQLIIQAKAVGQGRVGIFGLKPHFTKVFKMVGVTKYAMVCPDEVTALAQLDQFPT